MPSECCKETWAKIPDDEPVFILRGQDLLASRAIIRWIEDARSRGVNRVKINAAIGHLDAVDNFQAQNPERCKLPD